MTYGNYCPYLSPYAQINKGRSEVREGNQYKQEGQYYGDYEEISYGNQLIWKGQQDISQGNYRLYSENNQYAYGGGSNGGYNNYPT